MKKIAILGAGAWATALAKHLAEQGAEPWLWTRRADVVASVRDDCVNARYLPGVALPRGVHASLEFAPVLEHADLILLAVPSHAMRQVLSDAARWAPAEATLVNATKGIENESLMLMHEVVIDVLGPGARQRVTCLSGPSFAPEVAKGFPTAVVVAGHYPRAVDVVQQTFAGPTFRVYSSDDLCGVEVAGALKNVIAIAAGAADGLGFGHNTRAALITRGLAEIARLAAAKGGSPLTVSGLAGMGDLVLTCTGELSRNRTVGFEMGRGQTLAQTLQALGHVAEGVKTAKSAFDLSQRLGVEMPITRQVYHSLYDGKSPSAALGELMGRALRPEQDPFPSKP